MYKFLGISESMDIFLYHCQDLKRYPNLQISKDILWISFHVQGYLDLLVVYQGMSLS